MCSYTNIKLLVIVLDQINQDLTSDFESVPAVVLRNCMNPCPELCMNGGDWWYRSDKKFPITDSNIGIHCHIGRYDIVI